MSIKRTAKALPILAVTLAAFSSVQGFAADQAKVVNYTTATPTTPKPALLPYGYNDTARSSAQVVLSGISPSIIDEKDTSFDIVALVRPGTVPVQSVSLGQGPGGSQLFNYAFKHINTLKNGDQFWKYTYTFEAGSFGNGVLPIKWGNNNGQFFITATESGASGAKGPVSKAFPLLSFGSLPANTTVYKDTSKNETLSYSVTKRVAPQIVLAGVSPAIVDTLDTSFDVVAFIRPGSIPLQNVTLKQTGNNLFSTAFEKKKELNNGDEVWVATIPFTAGIFGTTTIPIVWGTEQDEYHIDVMDTAQQSSTAYPSIRIGNFSVK